MNTVYCITDNVDISEASVKKASGIEKISAVFTFCHGDMGVTV